MDTPVELLRRTTLFAGIREEDRLLILQCLNGSIKAAARGEYLSLEQQELKNIGIVLSGCVHMVKEDVWGNHTILAVMPPGDLFGETFCCGSDPSASVAFVAAADSEILFLPFGRVLHTCRKSCLFHQRLTENMVTAIADKNHALMEKLEVVSKNNLREKILAYLSQQAQRQGGNYFEIPLGRLELADYLCADRSSLTRELNHMRAEGLIDFEKNTFRLL